MKNKPWSPEEILFLKENYSHKGKIYCSEHLNREGSSVFKKASYLKLKVNSDVKLVNNIKAQNKLQTERPNEDFNVNIEQFLDIKNPEIAYLLGFLWADGYIVRNEIRLEILKTDMDVIKPILDSLGKWNYYERKRKHWQHISRATTSNKRLVEYLKQHNYKEKSSYSADKILSKIPEHLRHYFFRGLVDGDGFVDINRTRASISSSLEQDWSYLTNLSYKLDIKINIYKYTSKHSYSNVEFNGINAIKFCDYIYYGNIFGLKRKYNNYLKLKNHYLNSKTYLLKIKKEEALSLYNKGIPITKIIKIIDIPSTTLRRYLSSFI